MKKDIVLLFDLDGTLIDSTKAIVGTFNYTFEKLKYTFKGNEEDIKNLIGYPLDVMYSGLGVQKDRIQLFVDTYKNRYKDISLAQTVLLNDARKSLELASSFARLAIVTTKTTKYTIPLLEDMGIMKYFELVIGRQEVINPKPHPEPVLKAIEGLSVTVCNTTIYMIGDTKLDLIAANKANVKGVGVLCGYGKIDDLLQYTDMVYDTTFEAVRSIKEDTINK